MANPDYYNTFQRAVSPYGAGDAALKILKTLGSLL